MILLNILCGGTTLSNAFVTSDLHIERSRFSVASLFALSCVDTVFKEKGIFLFP